MYRYDIITLSPLPERFNPNRILHLRYSYMSFSRVFSTSSFYFTDSRGFNESDFILAQKESGVNPKYCDIAESFL